MLTDLAQYLANGLVTASVYILVALGLAIVFSTLDVVNFAHGELYMVGGFTAYVVLTQVDVSYAVAIVAAALVAGVVGLVIERLCFRPLYSRPHTQMILVSVGLILILEHGARSIFGPDAKSIETGLSGTVQFDSLNVVMPTQRLLIVGCATVLVSALGLFLRFSKHGKALRAVAEDPEGAATVGISQAGFTAAGFVVGAALAGIAGALIGPVVLVAPDMSAAVLLKAFIIIIIGGMGSIPGTVLAGLLLGVGEALIGAYVGARSVEVFGFAVVILVLLVRPSGLLGRAVRPV